MKKGSWNEIQVMVFYEILINGWPFFALISGHHIAIFGHSVYFSIHSRTYFAPDLNSALLIRYPRLFAITFLLCLSTAT